MTCSWCDEPIDVEDATVGIVIWPGVPGRWHLECATRSAAGSVGHQQGTCSCFDGVEEDPAGMTRRQAAKAAADLWAATLARRQS